MSSKKYVEGVEIYDRLTNETTIRNQIEKVANSFSSPNGLQQ